MLVRRTQKVAPLSGFPIGVAAASKLVVGRQPVRSIIENCKLLAPSTRPLELQIINQY